MQMRHYLMIGVLSAVVTRAIDPWTTHVMGTPLALLAGSAAAALLALLYSLTWRFVANRVADKLTAQLSQPGRE